MTNKHLQKFLARAATEVHLSHLAVIGTFAFVLISVLAMRGEISLNPFRAQANKSDTLTYEEAKAQVAMEMGESSTSFDAMSTQLAMVDPNAGDRGTVLGMTTGLNISDPIEKVFPPELMNQLVLTTTKDNSPESYRLYSEKIVFIESENRMILSLLTINQDDPEKLLEARENTRKMIGMMKSVEVPTDLVEYHRLKMVYYATLGEIAQSLSGDNQVDINQSAKNLMTIMDRLGAIKNEFYIKHKLLL
jgi:hypothetical protein